MSVIGILCCITHPHTRFCFPQAPQVTLVHKATSVSLAAEVHRVPRSLSISTRALTATYVESKRPPCDLCCCVQHVVARASTIVGTTVELTFASSPLQGHKGPTGPMGPRGRKGKKGPTGAEGKAGIMGVKVHA